MSALEWQQLAQREHYDRLAAEERIAELEAEVAELRKDKARLDWFSAYHGCEPMQVWRPFGGVNGTNGWQWMGRFFHDIRPAIDAAMERKG